MYEAWYCPECGASGLSYYRQGEGLSKVNATLRQDHRRACPGCPSDDVSSLRLLDEITKAVNQVAGATPPPPQDVPSAWSESEKFLAAWNANPHTTKVPSELNISRQDLFVARITDPAWLATYQQALARFPLKYFGEAKVPLAWFLKPDTVTMILTGSYDFVPRDKGDKKTEKAKKPSELWE